jgi:glucosamine-phosphate N-acetyltransferase
MLESPVRDRIDVLVRELEPDDLDNGFLDALAALSVVDMTAEQARDVYATLPPNLHTFVAVCDGRVVGTTSLLIERKFLHAGGRVGHIEDVAVSPALQGCGIGTRLVEYAIDQARLRGCYKVILDCFDPLVSFYERMGFRPFNRGLRLDLH